MKIRKVNKNKMKIPPKWLVKEYLALDLPMKFRSSDINENFSDQNTKNQFLKKATDFNLLVRLKRGLYFAPEPDITINTWAVDDYHSRLILLNSAFRYLDIDHVFYCLSADRYTDYSPERVIPVLKEEYEDIDQKHIDHFVYDFSGAKKLKKEIFETVFTFQILTKEDSALLLLSTYSQREVEAGKNILKDIELNSELRAALAGLGYEGYSEGNFKSIELKRPLFVQEWIEEMGFENLKERARK
ncbi:MAG: hypothetical protein KGY66_06710 [Candidatus Thermoplasmatota archaeon]|nr:hypothetical protein [Candidatus Thermoplasmatota archaeon]MBS3790590.1 hypothetical protein [Candidatus Thermoplasmatota archaeon]